MNTILDVFFLALFAWARLAAANYEPEVAQDAVTAKRTIGGGPEPEMEKREIGETWHLKHIEISEHIGEHHERFTTRNLIIHEDAKPNPTPWYRPQWEWSEQYCDKSVDGTPAYKSLGKFSDGGGIFSVRIVNWDRQLFADFEFTRPEMEVMAGPDWPAFYGTFEKVAMPISVLFLMGFEEKRTIGEEGIRGRSALGEALPKEARAEPRSLSRPRTKRRAEKERYNLEDAPLWTMEDLRREFSPPKEEGSDEERVWRVKYSFMLMATNSDGVINMGQEGVVSCNFMRYLPVGSDHLKESIWLQRCYDLDFYFSWGYIDGEDSAVVTVIYINPKKNGKSRIAWTAFQDVSKDLDGEQQLGTPAPMVVEEYVL